MPIQAAIPPVISKVYSKGHRYLCMPDYHISMGRSVAVKWVLGQRQVAELLRTKHRDGRTDLSAFCKSNVQITGNRALA